MLKFGLFLLSISSITCISNSTFESLKKGILPFNDAGNNFFNLIRGEINPSILNIDEFKNLSIPITTLQKITSSYLSHTILLAIGITFAILLPIVGFFFCVCRCCGKCGGKIKPMDPKNVRCKKIIYGICLAILAIGMMFAVVITLFNNQIVHESVVNPDPTINIFVHVKSQSDKIVSTLESMKLEINTSTPSRIDNQDLQPVIKDLDGAIKAFFDSFLNEPDVSNVLDQSKSIKQSIEKLPPNNSLKYVNPLLNNLSRDLNQTKENILKKLSTCTTNDCENVKQTTKMLSISALDEEMLNNISDILTYLNGSDFKERLDKMINMKANGQMDMKLILNQEIQYIRDKINEKAFSDSVKSILIRLIDRIISVRNNALHYLPSPLTNDSLQEERFKATKTIEFYRYYIYIALACGIVLIILFYFLGLLYGNCGERPEEDSGCFNRGVGANFLMISITITFVFSSFIMIAVLANLMTTSVIQTDFCRYAIKEKEFSKSPQLMDSYLQLLLKATTDTTDVPNGIIEGLFENCPNENFYISFAKISNKYIIESLKNQFIEIDNKLISNIATLLDLEKYLKSDPFANISSINFNNLTNHISVSLNANKLRAYLSDLDKMPNSMSDEKSALNLIIDSISKLRTQVKYITQHVSNIHNEYIKWKSLAESFNNKKIELVRKHTSNVLQNIEKNLLIVLNTLFGTMFNKVSCSQLRTNVIDLFKIICENLIDPINGTWYGLGLFLLLVIPALIFACLLVSLYRRVQKFYPDKDEPDYENYIGFYARADGEAMKSKNVQLKPVHRGYKPIPHQ